MTTGTDPLVGVDEEERDHAEETANGDAHNPVLDEKHKSKQREASPVSRLEMSMHVNICRSTYIRTCPS